MRTSSFTLPASLKLSAALILLVSGFSPDPAMAQSRTYTDARRPGNLIDDVIVTRANTAGNHVHLFDVKPQVSSAAAVSFAALVQTTVPKVDEKPPEFVSLAQFSPSQLNLRFSEPVDPASAESPGNYAISGGIDILAAILDDDMTVVHLFTSVHKPGGYTIQIDRVSDLAFNQMKVRQVSYEFVEPDSTIAENPLDTAWYSDDTSELFSRERFPGCRLIENNDAYHALQNLWVLLLFADNYR